MNLYVGVTDYKWYRFISERKLDEVNFWKPGTQPFKALQPGELYLFKLKAPYNCIVGGGFFVKYSRIPLYLAWDAFKEGNGRSSLRELKDTIVNYRKKNGMDITDPNIGCIILSEVFYFNRDEWVTVPDDMGKCTVQGKTYPIDTPSGRKLYMQVQERLGNNTEIVREENKYGYSLTKHRIGQGAFRVLVTDNYQRRCAITGEKTLPVLEAAHIKPVSENGPYIASNGLLLKSDFHTLFDDGYITIDSDYRIDVSKRLHDDYGNGRDYYKYHGQILSVLPKSEDSKPSKEFLRWHNENVFLG